MRGIAETLLAVSGFGRPSKPAPQRRRSAAARPKTVVASAGQRRVDSRAAVSETFGGAAPSVAPTAARAPNRARSVSVQPQRKTRRFSGFGMLLLATMFLAFGGWMGSQVQALALGTREIYVIDPTLMHPVEGPAYTF